MFLQCDFTILLTLSEADAAFSSAAELFGVRDNSKGDPIVGDELPVQNNNYRNWQAYVSYITTYLRGSMKSYTFMKTYLN
jgi:hypothetical protein